MLRRSYFAVFAIALAGCASYSVNVASSPDGATLWWQNGAQIGATPQTLSFEHDPKYVNGNCFQVHGVTAVWTSGATRHSLSPLRLCNGPGDYYLRLDRPGDAPGLQTDLRIAEMRARQRALQEQQALEAWGEAAGALGYVLGSQ